MTSWWTSLLSMMSASTFSVNTSRMIPRVSLASRWISAGGLELFARRWIFFQVPRSVLNSRSKISRVSSSPTVRMMTPPAPSGTVSLASARSRERSSRSSILRLTPMWSE